MVNGLTREQCRTARAALSWSQQELATLSGVGSTSVKKFELGTKVHHLLVEALRRTFEAHGVGFIDEGGSVGGKAAAFGVYVAAAEADTQAVPATGAGRPTD